ncbi:MAG: SBBP repeat-containing protein [Candidatus Hodarchaeales archaeon]|jgi:hypothetical protein
MKYRKFSNVNLDNRNIIIALMIIYLIFNFPSRIPLAVDVFDTNDNNSSRFLKDENVELKQFLPSKSENINHIGINKDQETTLAYSTFIGGKDIDNSFEIILDSDNNVYITGRTLSYDFPVTDNASDSSYNYGYDAFVTKLSNDGSTLIFSTYIGGSGDDYGRAIMLDNENNVYIAGSTTSKDFPTTSNAYDSTYNGGAKDIFIVKLSADGSEILYSTYIGGKNTETCTSLALDSSGNMCFTGATRSIDYPTTDNAFNSMYSGGTGASESWVGGDVYITKLSADGSTLLYSTFIGGFANEQSWSIALDNSDNMYFNGYTESYDFPTTNNAYRSIFSGMGDSFACKLSTDGSELTFSTFIGGISYDVAYPFVLDDENNMYIPGYTYSHNFPTTRNAYDQALNNGKSIVSSKYNIKMFSDSIGDPYARDGFLVKLAANGSNLLFSTYIGGSSHEETMDVALDSLGNIIIIGTTHSSDFPVTYDNLGSKQSSDSGDVFVSKISTDGSNLLYSTCIGGSSHEEGMFIDIDSSDNVYITGWTFSNDFPVTSNAYDKAHNNSIWEDVYVCKLEFNEGNYTFSSTVPTTIGANIYYTGVIFLIALITITLFDKQKKIRP